VDKINALSNGEKLIAGGGILMLIASFLPWYKVSVLGFSVSFNGWEAPGAIWSVLAVIISVILAAAVLAPKLGNMQLPNLGTVTYGQVFLGGGVLVALCIILKLINESSSMSYGFFLGILAAAAIAGGGYLLYTEEKGGMSAPR
jgi:hypothetical protein